MIKKERNENRSSNIDDDNNTENSYLKYIKIDNTNKIHVLEDEMQSQILMEFVNSAVEKEDNIGQEINKFFIKILPENKDGDILKANYAIYKIIRNNSGLNRAQKKSRHEECMTQIMNIDINQCFILTREIGEILAFALTEIFKKIKHSKKFFKIEDLIQYITEISLNNRGILHKYKYKEKNEMSVSSFIYLSPPSKDDNETLNTNKNYAIPEISRVSKVINSNNEFKKNTNLDINSNNIYKFKEIKTTKPINIPLEILILREKFEKIKKLKLVLKRNMNNNEIELFEEKDIINIIFILFNLKWLFPFFFEIELDLTNENILKDVILSNSDRYEKFMKKAKRNRKMTNYQSDYKKPIFDINKNSIFNTQEENNEVLTTSFSMVSSVKDNKDEEIKKKEDFLNKHKSSLEMIIIYWYFISRIDTIITCNYTIPINLEDKILLMLKDKKIFLFDFNILSNLTSIDKIAEITLDFNSLDNKLFQQVLNFLINNNKMKSCRLSFFPSEEYFEPRFLLNLLLNSDNSKGAHYIDNIRNNEDIDLFLLRKLSEFFELNMNKFFSFLLNNWSLKELSLIFDMPSILNKIDYYELIIMKLIINIFIYLDNPNNIGKILLNSLTIIADNLFLDNKKHPFLNYFFENINIFSKNNFMMQNLTLRVKMKGITNIYKIIPYHVQYLSLGIFDLEAFEYFVEYITSIEFNIHSEIKSLQVTLGNDIIYMEQCFYLLQRLLVEYPRNLEEICIYTEIIAKYDEINQLLEKTNYNKIEKIFIQFSKKSLKDKKLRNKYGKKLEKLKDNRDYNYMDLYLVRNNKKEKEKILREMYKIGKRYNTNFMDYHIFLEMEKFLLEKDKKQLIIQYK